MALEVMPQVNRALGEEAKGDGAPPRPGAVARDGDAGQPVPDAAAAPDEAPPVQEGAAVEKAGEQAAQGKNDQQPAAGARPAEEPAAVAASPPPLASKSQPAEDESAERQKIAGAELCTCGAVVRERAGTARRAQDSRKLLIDASGNSWHGAHVRAFFEVERGGRTDAVEPLAQADRFDAG